MEKTFTVSEVEEGHLIELSFSISPVSEQARESAFDSSEFLSGCLGRLGLCFSELRLTLRKHLVEKLKSELEDQS